MIGDSNIVDQVKQRVLVVEDEEVAQIIAQRFLEQLNCEVDIANTGHNALQLITENDYNLIFMDLGIFDIDGLKLTKQIRNLKAQTKNIPIIAVTSYHQPSVKKRALSLGLNGFVIKPLTLEQCQEILNTFLTAPA